MGKTSGTYPSDTHSVLFTNVNGSKKNTLVYTTLTVELLSKAYAQATIEGKPLTFDEAYIVPPNDRQQHQRRSYLTNAEEQKARELANWFKGKMPQMVC